MRLQVRSTIVSDIFLGLSRIVASACVHACTCTRTVVVCSKLTFVLCAMTCKVKKDVSLNCV